MVGAGIDRVLFVGIARMGVMVVQGLSRRLQGVVACTSKKFPTSRGSGESSLLPGGDLMFSWFQEIQEAKNDLRGKGVTVD